MVTARTEAVDVIRGLGLGADDYITNLLIRLSWWRGCAPI